MFTPSLIDVVWGDVLELACYALWCEEVRSHVMYEGGGAPLRGMWRWFENFNQFVSMLRPGPGVCWPDWSYLEWWSQPHTSCLTTRDLNRACQAPSQSPHCKVCKEVHCRVSPPLLSGDIASETLLTLAWPVRCVGNYGALRLGH